MDPDVTVVLRARGPIRSGPVRVHLEPETTGMLGLSGSMGTVEGWDGDATLALDAPPGPDGVTTGALVLDRPWEVAHRVDVGACLRLGDRWTRWADAVVTDIGVLQDRGGRAPPTWEVAPTRPLSGYLDACEALCVVGCCGTAALDLEHDGPVTFATRHPDEAWVVVAQLRALAARLAAEPGPWSCLAVNAAWDDGRGPTELRRWADALEAARVDRESGS